MEMQLGPNGYFVPHSRWRPLLTGSPPACISASTGESADTQQGSFPVQAPRPRPPTPDLRQSLTVRRQPKATLTRSPALPSGSTSANQPLVSSSLLRVAPSREKQTQKRAVKLSTPEHTVLL